MDEEKQVQRQVEQDIDQFDGGEFLRFSFQAQAGEGDQSQGIKEKYQDEVIDQLAVAGRHLHQGDEGLAQQEKRRGQQQ